MADDLLQLPENPTPAILDVLGQVPWVTGPIADVYRAAGHNHIARKMEAEHAFVLFRLLRFAMLHGDGWRAHAVEELEATRMQAAERSASNCRSEPPT